MNSGLQQNPLVAIACGGTGGHLYPGIAVAEELLRRDCDVTLVVSAKEVDQHAVRSLTGVEVQTVPAVGLTKGNALGFAKGFWDSYRVAKKAFAERPPKAILSMGGFTSASPAMAARSYGATVYLHESNTIPGKANRWLAHFADQGFVYFHETSSRLSMQKIETVGMPVRTQFLEPVDPFSARMALGLDSQKPVLLVMGGSQGAVGVNNLVISSLPSFIREVPDLQVLHLTGPADAERVRATYNDKKVKAVVHPFLTEMELALGAATVAVSRSGASSLAEIAAMKVPSILVPYPHAADNHQYQNALAFVESGAAILLEQTGTTPERFGAELLGLLKSEKVRAQMQDSLARWHMPNAAEVIAEKIHSAIRRDAAKQSGREGARPTQGRDPLLKEANV